MTDGRLTPNQRIALNRALKEFETSAEALRVLVDKIDRPELDGLEGSLLDCLGWAEWVSLSSLLGRTPKL